MTLAADETRAAEMAHAEALAAEEQARDELAAFAAAWAGSVYGGSPFFSDLRGHLDAYRDAVEARARAESDS